MASHHKSTLVPVVMLDIVHHVARYLSVTFWYGCTLAQRLKGSVVHDLCLLDSFGFLPLVVAILFINKHGFFMTAWHLVSVLVDWMVAVVLESHLVHGLTHHLCIADVTFAPLPSWFF